jgi:NAD(P)-dependent dehydrogenase (short-subunit alcohol dehydrogenase family)
MSFDLSRRRVLVTGAANGLGLGIARALGADGATVLLTDVDPAVIERAGERVFSGKAAAIVRDLAESESPELVIGEAAARFGRLDALVNCAAWSFHQALERTSISDFDRVVAINQRAPYFLVQHFVAQLDEQAIDPCVVNIGSVNALVGNAGLTAYAATKGALVAMTRALAVELAPRVRVLSISPASIRTHETEKLIASGAIDPETHLNKYLVRRFITVQEIAQTVAFLLSASALSVTGSDWVFDGGYTTQ